SKRLRWRIDPCRQPGGALGFTSRAHLPSCSISSPPSGPLPKNAKVLCGADGSKTLRLIVISSYRSATRRQRPYLGDRYDEHKQKNNFACSGGPALRPHGAVCPRRSVPIENHSRGGACLCSHLY